MACVQGVPSPTTFVGDRPAVTDAWGVPTAPGKNIYTPKELYDHLIAEAEPMECMNRNKRIPKKSNHGARPCSSVGRKARNSARRAGKAVPKYLDPEQYRYAAQKKKGGGK